MRLNRTELPKDYADMMKTEDHHQHEIIRDKHGTIRWKEDSFIRRLTDNCSLNNICAGFHANGGDKNTESYRELYRKMGYSLSGYWEIFYWDMNNDIADEYKQPEKEGVLRNIDKQDAMELATSFYVWWHNQPGTNTEQGFSEWWELQR